MAYAAEATHEDSLLPKSADKTTIQTSETSLTSKPGASISSHKSHEFSQRFQEEETLFWNPIWLRGSLLLSLVFLFVSMIVVLVALFVSSEREHGLGSPQSRFRYLWTYGPTIAFVLATSLWWRVDYWCKVLTPWAHLRAGSQSAKTSILMDYVSPILPSSLYAAVVCRDWVVVSSMIAYLFLKLGIIVSTGLLILEPTNVSQTDLPFVLNAKLNTSRSLSVLDNTALQVYYGIQGHGLPYPIGTSDAVVVPSFSPVNISDEATNFIATVEGLSSSLNCEVVHPVNASTFFAPWRNINSPMYGINISTPSCTINGVTAGQGPKMTDDVQEAILEQYQGWWGNYTCNSDIEADSYPPGEAPIDPALTDHRLVVTTSLVKWNSTSEGRVSWLDKFTTLLCNASSRIDQYQVELPQLPQDSGKAVQAVRFGNGNSNSMTGVGNLDMLLAVLNTTQGSPLGFTGTYYNQEIAGNTMSVTDIMSPDSFFLLLQTMKGVSDLSTFLDPGTLMSYAQKAFTGIFTQIAYENHLDPGTQSISGSVQLTELRLQMKLLSFILLLISLFIPLCVTIGLLKFAPKDLVPRDPQGIGAAATMLASSPAMQHNMQNVGSPTSADLQETLSPYSFGSHVTSTQFCITAVRSRRAIGTPARSSNKPSSNKNPLRRSHAWWTPTSMRAWFAALTVAAPLLAIAVLEVIQQISDTRNGFVNIGQSDSQKVWQFYIPATILACIAMLYSALQFATALLAPFLAMRHEPASATRVMISSMVGKSYVVAFSKSVTRAYASSISSIIAAVIGLFLTTVSSGLYYIDNVPLSQRIDVLRNDVFNISGPYSDLYYGDNFAGAVTGLIFNHNVSFPQWTYQDLVFPSLEVPGLGVINADNDSSTDLSSLAVQVPALRPSLLCSIEDNSTIVYPTFATNTSIDSSSSTDTWFGERFFALMPDACSSSFNRSEILPHQMEFDIGNYVRKNGVYTGVMIDMGFSLETSPLTATIDLTQAGICKSIGFFLARNSIDLLPTPSNLTLEQDGYNISLSSDAIAVTCYQRVQEVLVDAVFSLPNLEIDQSRPPVPIESTARYLASTYGSINFAFQLEDNMFHEMTVDQNSIYPNYLPPAIYAMTYGRWGVRPEEMLAPGSASKVVEAANRLFSYYIAQAINTNFRQKLVSNNTEGAQNITLTGTALQPDSKRLKQDFAVKLTLQIMLGLMAVCGLLAYVFAGNVRDVLLYDPCSIAGMMSLWSGSELITDRKLIPQGSEWNDNEEDERMWDGWVFSLGWWKTGTGGSGWRYGIDVGTAEDRDT